MRLARLDLTRYGKFTDTHLDFGAAQPGRPDLHVVYGPNEAGKSTAFSAFLDVLFGIEAQSGYAFLHPYKTMKVGAALDLGGSPKVFGRVKRPQHSLLDAADQPVGDGAFGGSLGGLDRSAYRHMFSLDDETLEKGGQTILASKGDLGQLLFAASAGLAELSQTLDALRAEADAFHRGRTRGELNELKSRLDELKSERDAIDTALPAYRKLVEASQAGQRRYEEALADRTRLQAQARAVERRLQALPRHARLVALRARLAPLDHLPQPPAHWRDELPELQRQEVTLATRIAGCSEEIARLAAERDGLTLDGAMLRGADAIDALGDLRDRYSGAEKDLPERRRSLADHEARLAHLLRRLDRDGEPDPERLVLGASATGALRTLMEQRSGIVTRLETARSQHADAEDALADAEAEMGEAGVGGTTEASGIASLKSALAQVRASDHVQRKRQAEKARAQLETELATALAALRPWTGTVEALGAGVPPSGSDVAGWRTRDADLARDGASHAAEIDRLVADQTRLEAARNAAVRDEGVVPEAEAAGIRQRRDAAWAAHRQTLRADTADLFEAALRQDDRIVAARLTQSGAVARLAEIGRALAVAEADLRIARGREVATRDSRERLTHELRTALDRLGWPEAASLAAADLPDWLKQRATCLALADRLRAEERTIADAVADAAEAHAQIAAALVVAGAAAPPGSTFLESLARAETIVERESHLSGLRAQVADRKATLARRARERAAAETSDAAWQTAWTQACAASWLGEGGAVPAVATVRATLDALVDLGPLLVQRADLALRIGKMEADQARYAGEVDRLAAMLAPDDPPGPVPDRAARLAQRLAAARKTEAQHAALTSRLAERESQRVALLADQEIAQRRAGAMLTFFGAATLAEVAIRLDEVQKRSELAEEVTEIAQEIVSALGAPSLDAAEASLSTADRAALEAEHAELKTRIDDLDQRTRTLYAEHTRAADALAAVGGDDRVARLAERRRTLLLDTEDKARRHLGLRIGIAAAEQALRAYRDQHRSSMMQRASDAFRTISRGAYGGLTTQPGEKGEILVATGPAGSKKADDLSKGTRFQLYLALRVAGYHEYCLAHEPVPFVADDIMETFDDFRAEEAFRLFADMAEVGQVIYLTHHRHLVDIARTVCPDVRVTELPAAA